MQTRRYIESNAPEQESGEFKGIDMWGEFQIREFFEGLE